MRRLSSIRDKIEYLIRRNYKVYYYARKIVSNNNFFLPHELDFYGLKLLFDQNSSLVDSNCFFDIGANDGGSIKSIRHIGYTGIIHAFEPNPSLFSELKNLEKSDPNLFIHEFGVAGDGLKQLLYVPYVDGKEMHAYSSTSKLESIKRLSADISLKNHNLEFKEIGINSIDLNTIKVRPWCLKLDTEGTECRILLSILDYVSKNRPVIYFEHYVDNFFLKMVKVFEHKNYSLYKFDNSKKTFYKPSLDDSASRNWFLIPKEYRIYSQN